MPNWTVAYLQHRPIVLAYLSRRLGRREDAEDLTQETFARAMASPVGIRDESRIKSYLLSTAHNVLINFRRRPSLIVHEYEDESVAGRVERAESNSESVEAPLRMRELSDDVERALADLPADQSRAFRLGVLESRPYREVAAQTGWTVSKVKINVFRARKSMIQALRAYRREEFES